MPEPPATNYFLKQRQPTLNLPSVGIFLLAGFAAWVFNVAGQIVFPSLNWVPFLVRTAISLAMDILLLVVSSRLLKRNRVAPEALGLSASKSNLWKFLFGILIALTSLAVMEALIYVRVPFHFERGPLDPGNAVKEGCSFFFGNTLEELMFRGFLLVVLSRLSGWRIALLVTSLAFGVFHLRGLGLNTGLQMVASTATYSLIFGLSYILTQSLWTAIGVHVASNILLHAVFGLDGAKQAILVPVFSGTGPSNEWSLGALIAGALAVSCILYLVVSYKFKKERERTIPSSAPFVR